MKKRTILLLSALLIAIGTGQIAAKDPKDWDQEHESRVLSDRFWGTAGGFLVGNTTDASIGSGGVIGTNIQLEDTLGLEKNVRTFRSDGFWRFGPKHSLGWTLWSYRRDGTNAISESITIDEDGDPITIDAGVIVDSNFKTSLFGPKYRYSFINNGKTEAGISASINAYKFDLELSGTGFVAVGDDPPVDRPFNAKGDFLAPVPSVGIFINHAFFKGFLIKFDANWLKIDYQDLSGRMSDTSILVEFYPWENVGFGGGVQQTDIAVSMSGDDPWSVTYKYSGFLMYVAGVF